MNVSIPVQVSNFPSVTPWAHLNGPKQLDFSWSAILRAAMVAGYPDLASIPSHQFARWRTAALRMALRCSGGRLVQPPEWTLLDPSEKAAISSLLGVAVTKLLIERLLNAPLFLFLDVHFSLSYPPGASRIRPDFTAMTASGEWFSVEAKGKSRFRQVTLDNGKLQASALGMVNGQPVRTGVVCVTSFRGGKMEARFADPKPSGSRLDAKIEMKQVLRGYYGRLFRFREFSEPIGQREVPEIKHQINLSESLDLDVKFGLVPDLEDALREESTDRVLAVLKMVSNSPKSTDAQYLGPDGIIVIPGNSWRDEPT